MTADAPAIRDFYAAVVGCETSAVPMGTFEDFCLHPAPDSPQLPPKIASICHALGTNAAFPSAWQVCITVAKSEASVATATSRRDTVSKPAVTMGASGLYAVIQVPSGAFCGLFEYPAPASK